VSEVREVTELLTPGPAAAVAGLLGVPWPGPELPLLWHWVYLLDRPPQAVLGPDGHPARGGIPVPPGPGLRRMFAGGRVSRHGPLRVAAEATRRTWQAGSVVKQGKSGPLHFVTVRTEISQGGDVVISEEQDLVYREATASGPARSARIQPPSGRAPVSDRDWPVEVDPVLLFRFSALTYNAHRIHYDRDYARAEGYPDLVVHGPLQALLMAELARREATVPVPVPVPCEYSYRLVAPLFDGQGLIVSAEADPDAGAVRVAVRDRAGRATATGVIRPALRRAVGYVAGPPCVPVAMARAATMSRAPRITAAQPSIRPASARPAPCSPVRLIWLRAMWPSTIAGMVASGPNANCATPQARLAIASPLVLATGATMVVPAGTGGMAGRPAGRSVTSRSRSA